jgi:hypothetical protein
MRSVTTATATVPAATLSAAMFLLAASAALVPGTVSAADAPAPAEGVWKHGWKDAASGKWRVIGFTRFTRDGAGYKFGYLGYTYFGRNTMLPAKEPEVGWDGKTFLIKLNFGPQPNPKGEKKDLLLEYPLTPEGDSVLAGPVMHEGKEVAQTRFERVPDLPAFKKELEAVAVALEVEKSVSRGQIPSMRDNVIFWQKQIEDDRIKGRSTAGSLMLAEHNLRHEEARLTALESKLAETQAALVRLEAEMKAGGK